MIGQQLVPTTYFSYFDIYYELYTTPNSTKKMNEIFSTVWSNFSEAFEQS